MGQRNGLSEEDKVEVNKAYECAEPVKPKKKIGKKLKLNLQFPPTPPTSFSSGYILTDNLILNENY